MQNPGCGLTRIYLPRRWVNKGKSGVLHNPALYAEQR
jgi:hypothetical protein